METVIAELLKIARRCERVGRAFGREPVATANQAIARAVDDIEASKAQPPWFEVYKDGFERRGPDEQLHAAIRLETGGPSSIGWRRYTYTQVSDEIRKRAGPASFAAIQTASEQARDVFAQSVEELIPMLDAVVASRHDEFLADLLGQIKRLPSHLPTKSVGSPVWDLRLSITTLCSYGFQVTELARLVRRGIRYLEQKAAIEGNELGTQAVGGMVFIGHGRSPVWKDLKTFLTERLNVQCDEFNREPVAGKTAKERLEEMLDDAGFAFLVLTGEDLHHDGEMHARENVVHEAGLFQGRLGFTKAILLVEDGCKSFSNIAGLQVIPFPKADICAKSEEIRRVLEREHVIEP